MAEEWSELVWTGVSLIIAALVISLAFTFTGLGKDLTAQLYDEQATVTTLQEIRMSAPYDETVLTGSEVLAATQELAGHGIPTLTILNYFSATGVDDAVLVYNESSEISNVWRVMRLASNTNVASNWIATAADASNKTKESSKLIARVGHKQYTAPALVDFLDSLCTGGNVFADCMFKSHLIEQNGHLVGVYFQRLDYSKLDKDGNPTEVI